MTSQLKSGAARPSEVETHDPLSRLQTTHGGVLLKCEDPDDLRKWLSLYTATYQPASPIEERLVGDMVVDRWRIERFRKIESVLKNAEFTRQSQDAKRADQRVGFRAPASGARALLLLSRFQSSLRRAHERSFKTLLEFQLKRNPKIQRANPGLALDLRDCKTNPRNRYFTA